MIKNIGRTAKCTKPAALSAADIIIHIVSEKFQVSIADLAGPARPWRIAWPRMLAMALILKHTGLKVIIVAELFAKNKYTVYYAQRRVPKEIEVNRFAAADFRALEDEVKSAVQSVLGPPGCSIVNRQSSFVN